MPALGVPDARPDTPAGRDRSPIRWTALTVVILLAAGMIVAFGLLDLRPAHADTVTVPYVDRLGCGGSSDAVVTPVFSWNGSGTAVNGGAYTATTSASAYPATTGTFSGVSTGTAYTVYSPAGYGSDFEYRGALALGFPNVSSATAATLTMTLPYAQAVQFTVGGLQRPSQVVVSGSAAGGTVVASGAARSGVPFSTTATQVGSAVRIDAGTAVGGADAQPRNAADVWFTAPVSTVSITVSGVGTGIDGGLLVTAPMACQSGTIATAGSVGTPAVDAAAGRVVYPVTLSTTVSNTSPATGAALHPSVNAPLASALAAQGFSLDAVTFGAASGPACTPAPGANGTGALIAPGAARLPPSATCTLSWSATVSAPQEVADRAVTLTSTLSSSAAADARVKSTAPTALTFPGLTSQLAVSESGSTEARPGQTVAHATAITNTGQGTALGTVLAIDTGGATPTGFGAACVFTTPTLTCDLGNIAPQASASVSYSIAVPAGAADGSAYSVAASATSPAQPAPATSSYTLTVLVRPPPPPPPPLPPPNPAPAPAPAPIRSATPRPAPAPTPVAPAPLVTPIAPPAPAPAPEPETASALPLQLTFAASRLTPGTVSTMRGTLGPHASAEAVTLTLSGRVGTGMIYRSVRGLIDGADEAECDVSTREFSCVLVLEPGQSADMEVRLLVDALNAPDVAVQQVSLASSDPAQDNAATISTEVARERDTDAWAAMLQMDMSSFPGAFVPLLALLLFALAASVAQARPSPAPTIDSADRRSTP